MTTLIRQLATQAFEECAEQHRDADGPVAWAWEERFAELIIEECLDAVCASDPNPKLILHEPFRTVFDNIVERFWPDEV